MRTSSLLLLAVLPACVAGPTAGAGLRPWRVGLAGGDPASAEAAVRELSAAFAAEHPGHAIAFLGATAAVPAAATTRVCFVQRGGTGVRVDRARGDCYTTVCGLGDALLLGPGDAAVFREPVDVLAFTVPAAPPAEVPPLLRPDFDPRLTDTPGGCATATGAYRRLLLTWRPEAGPYVWRALNAHRVRIDDSFTHYHPRDGGFDEFYLVQAVQPGAQLLTSDRTAAIVAGTLRADEAATAFTVTELAVGDLIWLPRGLVHRGRGGALVQVITVPGFVPGAEIAVDQQLQALNERHGLRGEQALPVHRAGAAGGR